MHRCCLNTYILSQATPRYESAPQKRILTSSDPFNIHIKSEFLESFVLEKVCKGKSAGAQRGKHLKFGPHTL